MQIPTSSFLRPLMRGPHRPWRRRLRAFGVASAFLMLATMPVFCFWMAYSRFGMLPWDAGFLGSPLTGSGISMASRGEVMIGLGWIFATPFAALGLIHLAERVLARFDRAFTVAGSAVVALVLGIAVTVPFVHFMSNLHATAAVMSATHAAHDRARGALIERGLRQEAKVLDASYVKSLREMFRDR